MNNMFGLAQIKPEGATIINTPFGNYIVTGEDKEHAIYLNREHDLPWTDKRTKGWKYLWNKAMDETSWGNYAT